jgi:hypothetical protein
MITFRIIGLLNAKPVFNASLDEVLATCPVGGRIEIYDVDENISDQQRKWYRGVCLRGLSQWNGETIDEWDYRLKLVCGGNELLKKERIYLGNNRSAIRLSISGVNKDNMTRFIENILSRAITENWPVTPPEKQENDEEIMELDKFCKPIPPNAQNSSQDAPGMDIPAKYRYECPSCGLCFEKPYGTEKDRCPKLHKGIIDRWAKADKK